MNLNDLLTRQNVFTKLILKDCDKELPKELKVKVMRIRMSYAKIKRDFDNIVNEFTEELITPEFRELAGVKERTHEEEVRFKELSDKFNSEYQEFLYQKGLEEVTNIDDYFTESEWEDLLEVNSGNDVEFNGVTVPAIEFLDIVYDLFVNKE